MEKYIISPVEDWVTVLDVNNLLPSDSTSPYLYSLVDYQELILPDKNCSYRHTVEHINDVSRIEDASLCMYEIEEENHQVVFNSIEIIRSGERINVLDENNITITQREKSLENHVADYRFTVSFSIDDLREGDIIDYKVTEVVTSSNHPIRGQYFYSRFWLSWSCVVDRQRIRIVNKTDNHLCYQHCILDNGIPLDKTELIKSGDVFEQEYLNLYAKSINDTSPNWLWANHVLVTTDVGWETLAERLYNYYCDIGVLDSDMHVSEVPGLELSDNEAESIINVIRFVQNNIRYKSDNFGVYTHTPKKPDLTLQRRRGDCKDKSNLLVSLLRQLNIEANLALVNSQYGNKLKRLNPSPYHFDHMVVHVTHGGSDYFIDPTIKKQAGNLKNISTLDYKYALILSEKRGGLTKIPHDRTREVYNLTHIFDFTGYKNDACTMEIRREFRSNRADNMRYYLNSENSRKLESDYLGYAREETEHNLTVNQPLTIIEDDIVKNILVTNEKYNIHNISKTNDDNMLHLATSIYQEFPKEVDRDCPVRIDLDGSCSHLIEVIYDKNPLMGSVKENIKNMWFNYEDKIYKTGNKTILYARATPYKTYVESKDLDNYFNDVEKMTQRSVNNIPHLSGGSGIFDRFGGIFVVVSFIIAVIMLVSSYT